MDGSKLLEAGKIVNTHGVRGEVKILPWADSPEFLTRFDRFYIDGAPIEVINARVHKNCVIAELDGVSGVGEATALKNKIVCIDRAEAHLEDGQHFVADLIGLKAVNADSGDEFGIVGEVLTLPARNVYVVKGEREILIPAAPEFVVEINTDAGFIRFRLIEGM